MSFFLCCCAPKKNKNITQSTSEMKLKPTMLLGRSNTLDVKIKIFQTDTQPSEEIERREVKFNTLKSVRFKKSHPLQNYIYPRDI